MSWCNEQGGFTWFWGFPSMDRGHTRLITGARLRPNWPSTCILFNLLLDAGVAAMMRKSMLGTKRRAEQVGDRWLLP